MSTNAGLQIKEVKISKGAVLAIDAFMKAPIGPAKILKLDAAKEALKQDRVNNRRLDPLHEYGVEDLWYRVWQIDKSWIDNYLGNLEQLINSTDNKKALSAILSLLPYNSGNEYKDRVGKLDELIHEKKSRKKSV